MTMPDGKHLENQYDAEYLRAGMVENGTVATFSYYNGELLAESSPEGDTISRYIPGYGVAAGWNREKSGYHYYHLDEQNSTAYITGSRGEIENRYEYDAFGVLKNSMEEFHNRILYTGQQYDRISEQYYLRARYYNPVVGRFLQEDVYRGDGLNLYAYCSDNPVVYYDPSGYSNKNYHPEIIWPSKPHNNRTPGHWETIIDQVSDWRESGEYDRIYVNKGIKRELGEGNFRNNRPDVWGVRRDNGKIDQIEVPSLTDDFTALQKRMEDNQKNMGERAGTKSLRVIPDKYKNNSLSSEIELPDELLYSISPKKKRNGSKKKGSCKDDT